jgi:beta-phosphoglucomutase-like phosphatase (HAD superfamily)
VVFDFDGVLADTERLHLAAFQDVFGAHDWILDETEYFDRYLGYDDRDLVTAFARDRGLEIGSEEAASLLRDKARRFSRGLETGQALFPYAADCVGRLGRRYRLAIASGSLRQEIVSILAGANLMGAFEVIVGADDVAHSKPAPDPYREAVRQLGVNPHDAVAIEDSRWGLESAQAAGLGTIGLTTSYAASALGRADAVVASLEHVTVDLIRHVLAR